MTLTAAGLVLAVVRRRPVEVAIAVMTVVYFVIVSVPITRFERNLVPILPAFAVLAGLPIDAAVTGVRRWGSTNMYRAASMLLAAIVVMASFQPARLSVERIRSFLLPDTRTTALAWIQSNLAQGSTIVREEFTPQVSAPAYRSSWVFELRGRPLADYRGLGVEYLIASSFNIDRYQSRADGRAYYDEVLAMPIMLDLRPSSEMTGPRMVIVRLTR